MDLDAYRFLGTTVVFVYEVMHETIRIIKLCHLHVLDPKRDTKFISSGVNYGAKKPILLQTLNCSLWINLCLIG